MTYNATKKQLFVKEETNEFVAVNHASLLVAENASFLPFEASIEWDPDLQAADTARTSFTKAPKSPGKQTGTVKVSLNLTASGASATTDPQFQALLRACGLRSSDLTKLVCSGALTGTGSTNKVIRHGTLFSGSATPSGTATGMVIGDVHLPDTPAAGSTIVWLARQEGLGTGVLTTGDITLTYNGAAAGTIASAAIGSITANAGTGFWPSSTPISKLLFDSTGLTSAIAVGDILRGATSRATARVLKAQALDAGPAPVANASIFVEMISGHFTTAETIEHLTSGDTDIGDLAASGFEVQTSIPTLTVGLNEDGIAQSLASCRGTATITLQGGRPGKIAFEMRGVRNGVSDTALVDGVTFNQRVPPVFKAAAMTLAPFNSDLTSTDQSPTMNFSPCVSSVELALNNNLTLRECANATEGAIGYVIDDRAPTLKIDPLVTAEADFGWLTKMQAAGLVRGSLNLGTTPPDMFVIGWPAGQVSAAGAQARGKEFARSVTLDLTCGVQDSTTGENEFWLIWRAG